LSFVELKVQGVTLQGQFEVTARNTTNRYGSYRFYLPTGNYSFYAKPGRSSAHVAPRIANHEVMAPGSLNLDLSGTEWRGTVRDSVTGTPLKSVAVMASITWLGQASRYMSATSVSDRKGRFSLVLEPGRTYLLSLSRPDGRIAPKEIWGMVTGRDSSFDVLVRNTEQ